MKKIDKNDFFRRAAMQLCGNLDIDQAMFHCLKIIKEYIPVDLMVLSMTEVGLRAIRRIAVATQTEAHALNDLLPMKAEGVMAILEDALPDFRIINDLGKDPVTYATFAMLEQESSIHHYTPYKDMWDSSMMVMVLSNQQKKLGAVTLRAKGTGRYRSEHLELFSLLHEPFTIALSNTLRHRELQQLKEVLKEENQYLYQEMLNLSNTEIIGSYLGLKGTIDMVKKIAPFSGPVILLGETGVGKELIANLLHHSSNRNDRPFIKMNCGAIPENLIDSDLFGHEKGAFTGATSQRRGRFERAHGGSIFLDEIGELPLQAQVRLLRAIQYGEFERVGGTRTISVDTRIIAASNRNLSKMVKKDQFREDLWYRLNVFPITIPPLRNRKEDISLLLNHFVKVKSRSIGIYPIPEIDYYAIDRLKAYNWPGNVRELENVVERELVLSRGGTLKFDRSFLPEVDTLDHTDVPPERESMRLDDVVAHHIRHILKLAGGRVNGPGGAADRLGMKSGTLRSRMDKLGIQYKKKEHR
ncbi:MAG: sigma 54-interacting transcriptional regulator [Thermodesulfobacteriota bacterium]